MQLQIVKDLQNFMTLKAEWEALLPHAATNTLFQTHLWHAVWLESYVMRGTPYILCAREGKELVGIAPFFIYHDFVQGFSESVLSFIGGQNYASDYCDLIVPRDRLDILQFLLRSTFERGSDWSYMELLNVPRSSPHYTTLVDTLRQLNPRVIELKYAEAPALDMRPEQTVEKLLDRKSIKRNTSYFRKKGALELRHCTTLQEIRENLSIFFRQHIERRAAAGDVSLFNNEADRAFYKNMIEVLFPAGLLRFSLLLWNGRAIACHLGFEYNNTFLYYKPTFDTSLATKSPGQVMLTEMLLDSHQRGFHEFDFTVGEEGYKYQFANQIRTNMKIWVYRRYAPYILMRLRIFGGYLKRLLREKIIRSLKRLAASEDRK